ncbi:MAG: exo-alpha-sialidase [Clostridia bacterium]|nr:exo-alpha-sialidase [Clostridia bacterium]
MDWRNIRNGLEIPTEYYSDQPYMIKADDGAWICSLTTGEGKEGLPGQYVMTMRSLDMGRTWSDINRMEPNGAPENSYSVLLKTSFGRIYCFYNYNKDNVRQIVATDPPYNGGICTRVDSQGYYVFRYSDNNGITWSDERGEVPIRRFRWDMENPYKGEIMFFWNVGKPLIYGEDAYLSIHKVGEMGNGFFAKSEGVLIKSNNIMVEKDITKLYFETLPEGDIGIRTPIGGGPVSEEHSYVSLSDGAFFTVFRTIDGRPGYSYSRDGGRNWEPSKYMPVRHPRAANFVWKLNNGQFLYWFHNNGGEWYDDRNPAWCLAGAEVDGTNGRIIEWSQPEILLYDDDPYIRISYPDLIQDSGKTYVTETQKDIARSHEIDADFLKKLFSWRNLKPCSSEDILFEGGSGIHEIPKIEPFLFFDHSGPASCTGDNRNGFTIEFSLNQKPGPWEVIADSRAEDGSGLLVEYTAEGQIYVLLSDGRTGCTWKSDVIEFMDKCNVSIIVDGGPKVISYVINGRFQDGNGCRQFGWGRFNPNLRHVNGNNEIKIADKVDFLRIYNRAIMINEAVANHRK